MDDNAKCVENCSLAGEWPTAEACCADLSTTPNGACWGTEQDAGVKMACALRDLEPGDRSDSHPQDSNPNPNPNPKPNPNPDALCDLERGDQLHVIHQPPDELVACPLPMACE